MSESELNRAWRLAHEYKSERETLRDRNALLEKENALLRKVREAAEHLMQTGWIRESADALGIALSACERGERTNG